MFGNLPFLPAFFVAPNSDTGYNFSGRSGTLSNRGLLGLSYETTVTGYAPLHITTGAVSTSLTVTIVAYVQNHEFVIVDRHASVLSPARHAQAGAVNSAAGVFARMFPELANLSDDELDAVVRSVRRPRS